MDKATALISLILSGKVVVKNTSKVQQAKAVPLEVERLVARGDEGVVGWPEPVVVARFQTNQGI